VLFEVFFILTEAFLSSLFFKEDEVLIDAGNVYILLISSKHFDNTCLFLHRLYTRTDSYSLAILLCTRPSQWKSILWPWHQHESTLSNEVYIETTYYAKLSRELEMFFLFFYSMLVFYLITW